jgi:hypothetical protein
MTTTVTFWTYSSSTASNNDNQQTVVVVLSTNMASSFDATYDLNMEIDSVESNTNRLGQEMVDVGVMAFALDVFTTAIIDV